MKLTGLQAEAVWITLVIACGADAEKQDDFVRLAQQMDSLEYRFQGNLGFGGKVYVGRFEKDPPRVSCYKEDETPKRRKTINNVNQLLTAIAKLW